MNLDVEQIHSTKRPIHWRIVTVFVTTLASYCFADEPAMEQSFRGKIVFFGNSTDADRRIETMNLDGTGLRTVLKVNHDDYIFFGGRVSPDGRFAAFTVMQPDSKKSEIWLLSADGTYKPVGELVDGFQQVTSWSPDGKRLAVYHRAEPGKWENLVVDVESRRVQKIPLPSDDVVGDWAPSGAVLTAMSGNSDKSYKFADGEEYPLRGLYLIKQDGTKVAPLTFEPANDFLWSRFSSDGRKIAYYRRYYNERDNFKNGHAFEACVIANADGSNSRDLVCFTKLDEGLEIKPTGQCCWSLDGKTIIWLVSNRKRGSDDDYNFELVLVASDGSGVRRIPLGQERKYWGTIDCR